MIHRAHLIISPPKTRVIATFAWLATKARITTSVGNLLHSQQPSECNYLLRVLGFMAIILLKLSSALKQSRLCKVDIYLQIQLHHHGISARCCPWGKAAWTNSLHTSSASFCWEGSPSNWTLSPPECWRVARRGNSWSASKILEIVAYMASTNPRGPRPHPELARFCPCKQLWITNNEFINQ